MDILASYTSQKSILDPIAGAGWYEHFYKGTQHQGPAHPIYVQRVYEPHAPNFCTFVSFVAALQMIELKASRINQTHEVHCIIFLIYIYIYIYIPKKPQKIKGVGRTGLVLTLSCVGQLWQQERPLLGLVSFQVFLPISLHNLFHATGDGFRS